MKKIDWRLLLIVLCALSTAAAAVLMTRQVHVPKVRLSELIPVKGRAVAELVTNGLQLDVTAQGITLTLPGCELHHFQDTFFVHVYTDKGLEKTPASYVNLDFALNQQQPKITSVNGLKTCSYYKSIQEFAPRQVNLGQFSMPGGKCCEIIWSRSYVFAPEAAGSP